MVMGQALVWVISIVSIALMLVRPFRIPEAVWAGAGAVLLCLLRLVPIRLAGHAVAEGADVYLFLAGMMLLSELAKLYGVFDWLAAHAVKRGDGSQVRLFTLIYGVGTIVTIFMSNDATAVVLTPAVLTAVKRAKAEPMPYLLICALIANAASFVLPISNPANLVVFHGAMPPLGQWMMMFGLPSAAAILVTYAVLRWYCRREIHAPCEGVGERLALSSSGKISLAGIGFVACVLIAASAFGLDLGLPTALASGLIAAIVLLREKTSPLPLLRGVSWSVLPLVAALFVIVEAVKSAGAMEGLQHLLWAAGHLPVREAGVLIGAAIAFGTNLVNNLPLGLIAGSALHSSAVPPLWAKTVLIGIDLGPNLSITGSLATILWLIAIRREGLHVTGWQFFKAGCILMPAALVAALATALLTGTGFGSR